MVVIVVVELLKFMFYKIQSCCCFCYAIQRKQNGNVRVVRWYQNYWDKISKLLSNSYSQHWTDFVDRLQSARQSMLVTLFFWVQIWHKMFFFREYLCNFPVESMVIKAINIHKSIPTHTIHTHYHSISKGREKTGAKAFYRREIMILCSCVQACVFL